MADFLDGAFQLAPGCLKPLAPVLDLQIAVQEYMFEVAGDRGSADVKGRLGFDTSHGLQLSLPRQRVIGFDVPGQEGKNRGQFQGSADRSGNGLIRLGALTESRRNFALRDTVLAL